MLLRPILLLLCLATNTSLFSQTLLTGFVRHSPDNKIILVLNEPNSDGRNTFYVPLSYDGFFSLDLKMLQRYSAYLYVGQERIRFYGENTDTTYISVDARDVKNTFLVHKIYPPIVEPATDYRFLVNANLQTLEHLLSQVKGKTTLIDFWATWCHNCMKEFKNMDGLRAEFQSKGIQFLYVSMDKPSNYGQWKKIINRYQLKGTHVWASAELQENLIETQKIQSIPRYMIVSRTGKIIWKDAGSLSMGKVLATELAEVLQADNQIGKSK